MVKPCSIQAKILLAIIFISLSAGIIYSAFSHKYNKRTLNELKTNKYHMSRNHTRDSYINDTEEQNNTRKWEFERITSEIEEQESRTNKYLYAFIGCVIALLVCSPLVFGCGPLLRFISSRFCNQSVLDNQNAQPLNVLPSDSTGPLCEHFPRNRGENRKGSVVTETAADLAGVPSTSNDSER